MSHMIERTQAVWLLSKEVDRFKHVGRVRYSMPFNRLREKAAGVIQAARLLVVESRYLSFETIKNSSI